MSVASVAQLLQEQGGGGSGSVNSILAGTGIDVAELTSGNFTIINDGIISAVAGAGINVALNTITGALTITNGGIISAVAGAGIDLTLDSGTGALTITNTGGGGGGGIDTVVDGVGINASIAGTTLTIASTVDPADYSTTAEANALYLTPAQAGGLYQPLTDMVNYSTTTEADALYQPIGSYQTTAGMADYSTTTEANALYAPINSGVTSIVAGAGIQISGSTGAVTITSNNALIIGSFQIQSNTGTTPLTPQGTHAEEQTLVGFYGRNTSSYIISVNEGAGVYPLVASIEFISSDFTANTTTIQAAFFNSSTTATINTGLTYSILIVNN